MMFKEYRNFFNLQECNNLIERFRQQVCFHERYRDTIVLKLLNQTFPKLTDVLKKDFNILLNYGQIVYWPPFSRMDCHLNDDFEGGQTLLEDKKIAPEVGKVIVFISNKMKHGVEKVKGGRFTYISWWRSSND